MDEIFGEIIGCGLGSDSIMLRLLRSAMDKAHEDVESTDGPIELLNARSKFYELAMILVEGCSKLIQEKAEVPERNREKMLSDLMESGGMVRKRLEELKFGIVGKDREMMERLENDCRFRQTLKLKERELVSLRGKLEEREEILGGDGGKGGGDLCELKNSVDQQVWSIKQRLEDERMVSFTGGIEMTLGNPEQKMIIQRKRSDMDGLKGTLDLAFVRMQNAEMGPLEKQWRWRIEKDTILVLIGGFMRNLKENFEVELERRGNCFPIRVLNENWEELVDEITSLHRELDAFCCSNEVEVKRVKGREGLGPPTKLSRASSEPLPEFSFTEEPNEDQESDKSNYVAKMVKSHESIRRRQQEELNRLKMEILWEKETSDRRLKDLNNLENRIQEVIARLGDFIKLNTKNGDKNEEFHGEGKMISGCLADFGEKVDSDSVGYEREMESDEEIRKLKQEKDDSNLETMMMGETYVVISKGLMKDFYTELENFEIESLIRDDILTYFFKETAKEWETERHSYNFENLIREEIHNFLIFEAAKDSCMASECEEVDERDEIEWLSTEEESTFSSASNKLEKALQPLHVSKPLLGELQESLGISGCDVGKVAHAEGKQTFSHPKDDQKEQQNPSGSVFILLRGFQQMLMDFEGAVHQKFQTNTLRLQELAQQICPLLKLVASLRKKEDLYKKAFSRRCHNLKLAETEVDLLGDQVDALLGLLEKIYLILDQYSPVLSRHFEVSDILKLIKNELSVVVD